MTCVLTEGFESVLDDTDVVRRGWVRPSAVTLSGAGTLGMPARTGQPGRGLLLRGPYYSAGGLPNATSAIADFGMLNTGKSIYSLWQAGGFVAGFSAAFNSYPHTTQLQVAAPDTQQIVYDGAQYYWAIGQIYSSSTNVVMYSTDLVNWTPCGAQPTLLQNAVIQVIGSGPNATIILGNKSGVSPMVPSYSTNMGSSWSTMAIGASDNIKKILPAAGPSSAPYIAVGYYPGNGFRLWSYASLSATPTLITGANVTGTVTYGTAWARVSNGFYVVCGMSMAASGTAPAAGSSFVWYCPTSVDPTVGSNWVALTSASTNYFNDGIYFNNRFVMVGYNGIYWNGAASNNTWINALTTGTASVYSIASNGSMLVAVGQDPVNTTLPAIWTSPDGMTWTKQNKLILSNAGGNGNNTMFSNIYWDGARWVLTGGVNCNVIATSTDAVTWTPLYYPDYPETGVTAGSMLGVFSGTLNAANNIFTPWSATTGVVGLGVNATPVSSLNRALNGATVTGANTISNIAPATTVFTTNVVGPQPVGQLTHYYELIATATASQNTFTVQWALDGVIQPGVIGTILFAGAADTGSAQLCLNLPRSGAFVMIDDIYVNTMNGSSNVGQLGPVSVFPWTPTSDTQAQMTASLAGSHAAQIAGPLSTNTGSLSTYVQGTKDIYATRESIPAGFTIKAVSAEAIFTKNGTIGGAGNVGITSNGHEVDSTAVSAPVANTYYFASVLLETDPNTGLAWTKTALDLAGITVSKTN